MFFPHRRSRPSTIARLILSALFLCSVRARAEDENPLFSLDPPANAEVAGMVIDPEYSLQLRMTAIDRIALREDPDDPGAGVDWLVALARNADAPPDVRDRALRHIFRLGVPPDGFVGYLTSSAGGGGQPEAWRLVCVLAMDEALAAASDAERTDIVQTLEGLVSGTNDALAGAALLMSARLAENNAALRSLAARNIAAAVANAANAPEKALAAVQAATLLADDAVLSAVRACAADAALEIRLRLAALGALGEMGAASDIQLVESVGSSSPIFRRAAAKAAAKINARLAH